MRRMRGIILRRELPAGVSLAPDQARRLHEGLIDELCRLHGLDYEAIGLGDLGKPAGYVERQVTGWSKRYQDSKTDDIPSVDELSVWLHEHLPESGPPALIHNDYKLDNVVLDPQDLTRIVGILDWEMCTIGDPLADLGTTLSYWVEAGDSDEFQWVKWGPTSVPGSLTRKQLVERYADKSGRDVSGILYYYCYGLFKTAVVLQQIYYRYKHGFTKDERFAPLIHGVRVLAQRGVEAIGLGHV
jgi:aminoglycoside phosphotransferase (APT) family kinase protein